MKTENFQSILNESQQQFTDLFESEKYIPEFKGVKDNTTANSKIYEKIIEKFPHMSLLEKLGTSPRYAIYDIWDEKDSITFYMHQSFTIHVGMYGKDILKNIHTIQVPGNQNYTFSIGFNK